MSTLAPQAAPVIRTARDVGALSTLREFSFGFDATVDHERRKVVGAGGEGEIGSHIPRIIAEEPERVAGTIAAAEAAAVKSKELLEELRGVSHDSSKPLSELLDAHLRVISKISESAIDYVLDAERLNEDLLSRLERCFVGAAESRLFDLYLDRTGDNLSLLEERQLLLHIGHLYGARAGEFTAYSFDWLRDEFIWARDAVSATCKVMDGHLTAKVAEAREALLSGAEAQFRLKGVREDAPLCLAAVKDALHENWTAKHSIATRHAEACRLLTEWAQPDQSKHVALLVSFASSAISLNEQGHVMIWRANNYLRNGADARLIPAEQKGDKAVLAGARETLVRKAVGAAIEWCARDPLSEKLPAEAILKPQERKSLGSA